MKYSYKRRFGKERKERKERKTRTKKGGKKDWDRDEKHHDDMWNWEREPYKKFRSTKRTRKYDRK